VTLARRVRDFLLSGIEWRRFVAYFLMVLFIVGTTVGAAMLLPAAGWIVLGVSSAIVGYILGAD
jgi:hypothetical protein